jgi:hypothetical protein
MSGSAAKATRRDIRRAVGPAALDVVNGHDKQIGTLAEASTAHAMRLRVLEGWKPAAEKQIAALQDANPEIVNQIEEVRRNLSIESDDRMRETDDLALAINGFKGRGFWSRLAWLLLGK